MGYFSAVTNQAFKENPDGDGWLYYPQGKMSKARVIEKEEDKDKVYKFHKGMIIFFVFVTPVYGMFIGLSGLPLPHIVLLAAAFFGLWIYQVWLVKDFPVSNVKLNYKETISRSAKELPAWYFYAFFINGLALIAMAFILPALIGNSWTDMGLITLLCGGVGLFSLAAVLFLLYLRGK